MTEAEPSVLLSNVFQERGAAEWYHRLSTRKSGWQSDCCRVKARFHAEMFGVFVVMLLATRDAGGALAQAVAEDFAAWEIDQ